MSIELLGLAVSEQVEQADYSECCSDSGCYHRNRRKPKAQPAGAYTIQHKVPVAFFASLQTLCIGI
jgi:hypothetical protein